MYKLIIGRAPRPTEGRIMVAYRPWSYHHIERARLPDGEVYGRDAYAAAVKAARELLEEQNLPEYLMWAVVDAETGA